MASTSSTHNVPNDLPTGGPHHTAIVLFYQYFIPSKCPTLFSDHQGHYVDQLERFQKKLCSRLRLKGRILLSSEGINGTLSGTHRQEIQEYIQAMESFELFRDCGLPEGVNEEALNEMELEKQRLFENVDWKESSVDDDDHSSSSSNHPESAACLEPFPDLKINIVKEIVSTGGSVQVDEIPKSTGTHLSPEEFHQALVEGSKNSSSSNTDDAKPIVLIDVRNTFEHDIGHFQLDGQAAMNPEMVTFSSFDSNFCAKHADHLKDKKVLMYCTGGIRCEKASVMLKRRGVDDVSQLSGGIHRYLEHYGNDGFYKGLNFVFDQRVAMKPNPHEPQKHVVGKCVECQAPFDEICGSRVCTVCRDLVLVCPNCQSTLREYHCRRHAPWKDCYFTFLEVFDVGELEQQRKRLQEIRNSLLPPAEHKNIRRTLARQIEKVNQHRSALEAGNAKVNRQAHRRCRTCMEPNTLCDGRCWGFWKTRAADTIQKKRIQEGIVVAPILPIEVGDQVEPGDHWNSLRLGDKTDGSPGKLRRGSVVEVKAWAGDEQDCVAVMWDDKVSRGRNQGKVQPQIYRWGVLATNGARLYDVKKICTTKQ